MKKILAFMLAVCMYVCVLTACEEDEIYLAENTSETLTGESDTEAQESNSEPELGDDDEETKAEQIFGGLQELQPLK